MTKPVALSLSIQRLVCVLQYNGLAYHGSQSQQATNTVVLGSGPPTVQALFNQAFLTLGFPFIKSMFAGRTDAGVHALGQVAHVDVCSQRLQAFPQLVHSLNALLPADIRVLSVAEAPPGFHAQQSAIGKTYRYGLISRPDRQQVLHRLDDPPLVWHTRQGFDPRLAQAALDHVVGTHDFASFCRPKSASRCKVCTISQATVSQPYPQQHPDYWVVTLEGNRFLYGMVRLIMGLVVLIASAKQPPQLMHTMVEAHDFNTLCRVSKLAPAQGLCLVSVRY
jgi:tRNA pseudouridine38-40 synthase